MDIHFVHRIFEEKTAQFPDNTAVEETGARISYAGLNAGANQLAHLIATLGVGRESVVGVVLPAGIQLVTALLSVLKKGGVYLPLDLAFARKRLLQVFTGTGCRLVVTNAQLRPEVEQMLAGIGVQIDFLVVLDAEPALVQYTGGEPRQLPWPAGLSPENPPLEADPDDGMYILYTSGSTGEGKPILGRYKSLSHFIRWEIAQYEIDQTNRTSLLSQVTFDPALRDIMVPLCSGGTVCVPPPEARTHMAGLVEWIARARITHMHCVPSLFRLVTKEMKFIAGAGKYVQSVRHILLAGEILYAKDVKAWRDVAGNATGLSNLYGPTETTHSKAFYRIGDIPDDPARVIPVGKPIEGAFLAIISEKNQLCRIGEIGEIYIKTPYMSKGYYKRPDLTEPVFVQNPLEAGKADIVYKTGDFGRYLEDWSVEILGRMDDQVKINGIRVELKEVEQAVLSLEGVETTVVMAVKNNDGLQDLVCYYVGQSVPPDALRQHLKGELNGNIIPAYFAQLDAFPLNINGKVDKKALPKVEEIALGSYEYQAPEGTLEKQLESIWKETLGLKKVGRDQSFFKVGGHSLKAIQLISRIYRTLNVNLKLRDLFSNHTIGDLARHIRQLRQDTYEHIQPVGQQVFYEVAHAQKRLWVLDQAGAAQSAYVMPGRYELEGELDGDAFREAFRTLVGRHEILRTTFALVEGQLKQQIHPFEGFDTGMGYADLRGEADRYQQVEAAAGAAMQEPFDLTRGPLVRARLFRVEPQKHVFLFVLHHIVSDGWSTGVIAQEMLALYNAYRQGLATPLAPLRIQYKDYAAWQNLQFESEIVKEHQAYWHQRYRDQPPALNLPADYPRPPVKTYAGARLSLTLDPPTLGLLREWQQSGRASLFVSLLAAVNALLYRYTGQDDIVVGSPVAGREHEDLEGQIGFYVNTLALRTRLRGDQRFEQLLQQVKADTTEAFEHQMYPLDRLVEELDLVHDRSRSAMFDLMVTLQNTPPVPSGSAADGLTVTERELDLPASQFDLSFNFIESEAGLVVQLNYNTDLFARPRMERMLAHFGQTVRAVTGQPQLRLDDIAYLTGPEQQELLETFNDTHVAFPDEGTILAQFEKQAAATPEAVAVVFEGQVLTYRMLDEQANQVARLLVARGVSAAAPVPVLMPRGVDFVIAFVAVLKAGAAVVPLGVYWPPARLAQILEELSAKVLLVSEASRRLGVELPVPVLAVDHRALAGERNPVNAGSGPDQPVYVIYTSGSTGRPKGVVVPHRGITNRFRWMDQYFGKEAAASVLRTTEHVYDSAVWQLFWPLTHGGKTVIPAEDRELDKEYFLNLVEEHAISMTDFVPSLFNAVVDTLETGDARLNSLRHLVLGGEEIRVQAANRFKHFYPHVGVTNLYGPTEASIGCICFRVAGNASEKIPIGRPIANMRAYLLDGNGKPVAKGIMGEIYLAGTGLALGYLHNAPQTASVFSERVLEGLPAQRLYRTGDLGRYLEDGNIEFMGRTDDQVKIRGHRIEPGEIENALLKNEGVDNVLVEAGEDGAGNTHLVAYLAGPGVPGDAALRYGLKKYLPDYMLPARFIRLEKFPLTPGGKIDRKALPRPLPAARPEHTRYVAPQTATQARLATIWEEVLGKKPVGLQDNFFELGGHSLKAVRVLTRVHREMQVKIPLRSIFSSPDLAGLAAVVDATQHEGYQAIEALGPQAYYEVSDAQRRMWFLHQLGTERPAYHMAGAYLLKGDLDRLALQKALLALVERHESLRTTFVTVNDEPKQQIHDGAAAGFALQYTDLRQAADGEEEAGRMARLEARQSFDLERGPLVRAHLIALADDRQVLLFTVHHIIADGWSMEVLVQEVFALYNAFRRGQQASLAPLRIHYKDYVNWQLHQLGGAAVAEHRAYWRDRLGERPTVFELPADFPRPAIRTYAADRITFTLGNAHKQALMAVGRQQQTSLFMTLLATLKTTLYCATGQHDIIIGSPVAGRANGELENQIGLYLNMLALRTQLAGADTFPAVLGRVRETVLGAYDHQLYPFDNLVSDLQLDRVWNRNPLFNIGFTYNAQHTIAAGAESGLENVEVQAFGQGFNTVKADLWINVFEGASDLTLYVNYNTDLFRRRSVENLVADWTLILESIREEPGARLEILSGLLASGRDDSQKRRQLHARQQGLEMLINTRLPG